MIRIGMNKKSEEPINEDFPFYYTKNGIYTPSKNIHVSGLTRSFYDYNTSGKKIIWLETAGDVSSKFTAQVLPIKIHIDKNRVINREELPCAIHSNNSILMCNEFFIEGECSLEYSSNLPNDRTVYILCRDVRIIS